MGRTVEAGQMGVHLVGTVEACQMGVDIRQNSTCIYLSYDHTTQEMEFMQAV